LLFLDHDVDLQDDSVAFYVLEFWEGLLGDIDSVLQWRGVKKIHQQNVRSEV